MNPADIAKPDTERAHQMAVFAWSALNIQRFPMLKWMFAIKNAEKGGAIRGAMAQAEGVKAGVGDVFLPYPAKGYHGLFIEMKKPTGGVQSKKQIEFENDIKKNGYAYRVCLHWTVAVETIEWYLNGQN